MITSEQAKAMRAKSAGFTGYQHDDVSRARISAGRKGKGIGNQNASGNAGGGARSGSRNRKCCGLPALGHPVSRCPNAVTA